MKPYAEYKPTGLKWLPEVPVHWRVVSNKRLFTEVVEKKGDSATELLSFSKTKGLVRQSDNDRKGMVADDLSNYKIIKPGQLLENRLQAWNGMFIAADKYGCVSPDYSVFSPASIANVKYFGYLFTTPIMIRQFADASRGIGDGFNRLYTPQFGAIKSPLPPPEEQAKIVSYLDAKTAKIDKLIKLKEREIELLQEKKQAVIESIIASVPGKLIPLEFVVQPVSECGYIDLPLLSVYLNRGVVRFDEVDEKRTNVTSDDLSKYQLVKPGYLVMNNQQAWRGSVGVSKHLGIVSPAYVILRLNDAWDREYANCYFRSRGMVNKYVLASRGVGSIQRNLIWTILKQTKICVPEKGVQQELVERINVLVKNAETSISFCERQIALLKEYRTRLISDAVTGKIDLREVAG